jgi:hypothetical protein
MKPELRLELIPGPAGGQVVRLVKDGTLISGYVTDADGRIVKTPPGQCHPPVAPRAAAGQLPDLVRR